MANQRQMARRARLCKLLRWTPKRNFHMNNFFSWVYGAIVPTYSSAAAGDGKVDLCSFVKSKGKNECDTAGCVAGFAATIWPEVFIESHFQAEVFGELLGLNDSQVHRLTMNYFNYGPKAKARQLERMV